MKSRAIDNRHDFIINFLLIVVGVGLMIAYTIIMEGSLYILIVIMYIFIIIEGYFYYKAIQGWDNTLKFLSKINRTLERVGRNMDRNMDSVEEKDNASVS
jgi:cell shape-determining protein MreC